MIKKVIFLAIFAVLSATGLCLAGKIYIYDKIPGSEFCTYSNPVCEATAVFAEPATRPYSHYGVEFFILNKSVKPLDLRNASYAGVSRDVSLSYFEYDYSTQKSGAEGNLALEPDNRIKIFCKSKVSNKNIKDIFIKLANGTLIELIPKARLGKYTDNPDAYFEKLSGKLKKGFKSSLNQ